MTKYDYDVLYLGSGHATFDGAIPLAATGVKVGVIESGLIGGTCPNRGCNAKITLDQPVVLTRLAERLSGIVNGTLSIDWAENVANKQAVIDGLPKMIAGLMTQSGIALLTGHGVLVDDHTIEINGKQRVTGEKIVLAMGQRPNHIDVPGTELAHDSTDFMNLKKLPKHLAILGSGYISMEFATIANAAGSDVTVLMHGDAALRQFYQPFVQQVVDDLSTRGVQFVPRANVSGLEENGDQTIVTYGDDEALAVDYVLDATGRIPNVENLGLDNVGVAYTEKGITVNDHLQTSIANIYASGDVINKTQPKLTPTAIFESKYLSRVFSGKETGPIDYPVIPSVVFTSPRIAKAGISVAYAEQKDCKIVRNHIADDWYRQVDKQTIGDSFLMFDDDQKLVGATEVSEKADDAIDTLLPAIEFHLDAKQIGRIVPLFPSIGASAWEKL